MQDQLSKILLIDDEPDIVRTLSLRLAPLGYNIITAMDGLIGLELARSEKPDLILLDIMLPKLDGFKVCRMLKYDQRYKDIPIIMITAKATDLDKEMGQDVGADDYLTKPFDSKRLVELIETYLKRDEE